MILKDTNKPIDNDNLENDDVIVVEDDSEEEINTEEKNEDNNSVVEESNYESNQPFFKNKWVRYIVIAGVIIVLIVIFILIISACTAGKLKGFKMSKIPVLYVDENYKFAITPTEDPNKNVKYKFKVKDDNIAYVKYPTTKGKKVYNTIIPTMAGETSLDIKAGKAKSSSKIIVCNRLNKENADKEYSVKLNKTIDFDLGIGDNQACYENLTYEIKDKDVIEIKNNSLTGKKAGSTTVVVSDGKNKIEVKVKVSTKNIYITSLSPKDDNISLNVGDSKQLDVTASPSDATNKEIKWSSNDTKIATVDNNGVVTGKAKGSTTIKAVATDGSGKSTTIKISVNEVKSDTSNKTPNNRTTYYQYRTKNITTVTTEMCKFYDARYISANYYALVPYDYSVKGNLNNSLGIKLESNNISGLTISAIGGKDYVDYSAYCTQKKNGRVYWPSNPYSTTSSCNDWYFKSGYATPNSYIYSVSVSGGHKSSTISNGYEFNYSVSYNNSGVYSYYYNNKISAATMPLRFTVSYYALGSLATAKCSDLNATQASFVQERYTDSKQVTNYSDWKWTTNKNLPNAEYSGNTKVE